ncbi:MAG: ThiF family adenylyltransferase [Candidatus Hermodarchaeota archaeon]
MNRNRYTRIKAIEEFGYNANWDNLRQFHIGIIGVGGLGCVSAEMAVRCGVGKISLFDFDTVDIVNLNRHMYREKHIGQAKAIVASKILKEINPDVEIKYFNKDIMDLDFESSFEKEIKQMNIILNGLDNIPAREYLNVKCILLNIPYIDAGASRSGLSGYVHPIIPYKTACAKCISSMGIGVPDERGEPCIASLPSTMAILASIQIQEMLKYLLKFGEMIDYLMYNMVDGSFLKYKTKMDKNCPICGKFEK